MFTASTSLRYSVVLRPSGFESTPDNESVWAVVPKEYEPLEVPVLKYVAEPDWVAERWEPEKAGREEGRVICCGTKRGERANVAKGSALEEEL